MKEKCQKCVKTATYHITEIERGKPRELHFCDEHARSYLVQPGEGGESALGEAPKGFGKVGKAVGPESKREPSPADKQACPLCQITFLDFRNSGRLGCPHDYEVFHDELMPLLENIHDETRHAGKVPKRAPRNSQRQAELIALRNKLKGAVAAEDYEAAVRFRDEIKSIEQE